MSSIRITFIYLLLIVFWPLPSIPIWIWTRDGRELTHCALNHTNCHQGNSVVHVYSTQVASGRQPLSHRHTTTIQNECPRALQDQELGSSSSVTSSISRIDNESLGASDDRQSEYPFNLLKRVLSSPQQCCTSGCYIF